jgi:hypothetical protein
MIPVQSIGRALFIRTLPDSKFPKGSKVREMKAAMMSERLFRLFVYTAFTLLGLLILKQGN